MLGAESQLLLSSRDISDSFYEIENFVVYSYTKPLGIFCAYKAYDKILLLVK